LHKTAIVLRPNGRMGDWKSRPVFSDDLDVRVSVRAGEALITLGDLKKLGAGSILPMSQSDGDGVDLVVNGRRIGTGQLVRVGGAQAVEIKELFSDG